MRSADPRRQPPAALPPLSVLKPPLKRLLLNQSAETRTMLMLLTNEALYLRGMCANLSTQNAVLAHAFAVQLATNKRYESANAARVPTCLEGAFVSVIVQRVVFYHAASKLQTRWCRHCATPCPSTRSSADDIV